MPTYRDCIELDVMEMETGNFLSSMTYAQAGRLMRKMNRAYIAGDFDFVRSLPFVHKVHPHSSKLYRRHIPAHVRRDVLASGPCARCGTQDNLTIDHIIPVSRGGTDKRENLQPMCSFHNISKGNRV